jgi:flagellar biosynthesis protein FliQ
MSFLKDKKAQGALEYLLIIGGAIVLAAIVIAVVVNIANQAKTDVNDQLGAIDYNSYLPTKPEGA